MEHNLELSELILLRSWYRDMINEYDLSKSNEDHIKESHEFLMDLKRKKSSIDAAIYNYVNDNVNFPEPFGF